jgi:PLD-like domain
MKKLVTGRVGGQLKAARVRSSGPALVAAAYVGQGAARLLDLKKGSLLVADASHHAVKTGQTCPADLTALMKKGVRIFNFPRLHAKIYVFGKVAAVGSANASHRSADVLVESMLITDDAKTVEQARNFVKSIAKDELGPKALRRLCKLYRPPHLPGGGRKARERRAPTIPGAPRIRVVHLGPVEWSERDDAEHEVGERDAKRHRKHLRSWIADDFQWTGRENFRRGEKVMMVTEEGSGRQLVDAPGTVLHVRRYHVRNGTKAFVYLELPDRRRRNLKTLAAQLGHGWLKRLWRGGSLSAARSDELYKLWRG